MQHQESQYPFMPPPPMRRGVSRRAAVATATGTLILGVVIGYAAGRGPTTAKTSPDTIDVITVPAYTLPAGLGGSASTSASTSASSPSTAPAQVQKDAKIGDAVTLTGTSDGEKLTATLVKIVDPATGTDEFTHPKAGYRFAAVQFKLINAGTSIYSDAPGNGAHVIDTQGQSFGDDFAATTAGPGFPGAIDITPGNTALGFITFEIPTGSKLALAQFGMDSGFGQKGQWRLR